MIVIIDYDKKFSAPVAQLLDELGEEYIISKFESDIISADKIIFPDCEDLVSVISEMQMYNCFNILKIVNKPLLGINAGAALLCENIQGISKTGVGIFPIDSFYLGDLEKSEIQFGNCERIEDSILTTGLANDVTLQLKNNFNIEINDYTSLSYRNDSGEETSILIERGANFGILFSLGLSGESGRTIIKNFLKI